MMMPTLDSNQISGHSNQHPNTQCTGEGEEEGRACQLAQCTGEGGEEGRACQLAVCPYIKMPCPRTHAIQ